MSPTAMLLVVVSAFTHAVWNLLTRGGRPSAAFFLVGNSLAALCLMPLLLAFRPLLPHVPPATWGLLLAAGVSVVVLADHGQHDNPDSVAAKRGAHGGDCLEDRTWLKGRTD